MKIIVAGAGAGKTTSMAEKVIERYKKIKDEKIIYVITYTNAARDKIREKVTNICGNIPWQIKIETIHVFLLQEIIFPFHHLLYDQQYTSVSLIDLPENYGYRSKKLSQLRKNKIIHVNEVTKIAKYTICGKKNDNKKIRNKREKLLLIMQTYLDSIFIDEAQDMDKHLSEIIEFLCNSGIKLHIIGDPKQDLRGRNELRRLIEKYPQYVIYKKENYRCPISHVNLANLYVTKEEKQEYCKQEIGKIDYIYENDIEIYNYIKNGDWCHCYILNKNDRFITGFTDSKSAEETLVYELEKIIEEQSDVAEKKVKQVAYFLAKKIIRKYDGTNPKVIISKLEENLHTKLRKQERARLYSSLEVIRDGKYQKGILVKSIDKVKGLEGEKCLFILTTALSDYLFMEKTDKNKMLNYLYVALTRSMKELMIVVTKEVENKYGRNWIDAKFKELLTKCSIQTKLTLC